MQRKIWTDEKLDWLKKSKETYDDREDILDAFNKQFNTNVSLSLLTKQNNRYKLCLPKANKIITKGLEIGWIKQRGFSKREPDYIQEYDNGDRTFIKVEDSKTKDGFVQKNRYLYEQYYNVKLHPNNDVIIFLNGNNKDFSKENLYKISRKVHTVMATGRLYKKSKIVNIGRIKCFEWKLKLNELGGKI